MSLPYLVQKPYFTAADRPCENTNSDSDDESDSRDEKRRLRPRREKLITKNI